MYRIGICDDEMTCCMELEQHIEKFARQNRLVMEAETFASGEDLFKYLENEGPLDLLFLDVELGGMNGVEVGQKLRQEIENEVTQIVYVSKKESYAMQLFQIRPLDFLTKPVGWKKVSKVMTEYKRLFIDRNFFFTYHNGKSVYRISENEIQYFQCEGKKILVVTTKGTREFYGKMSDVEKQISIDKFCTVHKSYIVNINYVAEFRPDEVIMRTGTVVPISQSFRKKVRERVWEWNTQGRK